MSRRTVEVWLLRLGLAALLLGLWQVFAGGPTSILPQDVIGKPSSVLSAFWSLVENGSLFSALGNTIERIGIALIISVPIGLVLGLITASRPGRWIFEPVVAILYAIPKVALISIFILVLGARPQSLVTIVVTAVAFVYYYSTEQAIREIDRDRLTSLRLMGAGPLTILRIFLIPSVIPQLFAATRIAIPLAFSAEVFGELLVPTAQGLGVELARFELVVNGAGMMAVLLFIVFLAYALDTIAGALLRRYATSIGTGVEL